MDKKHPDLAAINRVGTRAICDHFAITRQSLHHWRKVGVPKQYRKSLIALGESLGHDMSDLRIALSVADRKSVVSGKSVSVRVVLGGRRIIKKKKKNQQN